MVGNRRTAHRDGCWRDHRSGDLPMDARTGVGAVGGGGRSRGLAHIDDLTEGAGLGASRGDRQRSYGLYLWHWPVLVLATGDASAIRAVGALAVAVALNEITYRYVELPWRHGRRAAPARAGRVRHIPLSRAAVGGVAMVVVGLAVVYVNVSPYDPAVGSQSVEFDLQAFELVPPLTPDGTTSPGTAGPAPDREVARDAVAVAADARSSDETGADVSIGPRGPLNSDDSSVALTVPPTTLPPTTLPATSSTLAQLPRGVVIVGDSQARSFVVNLPDGARDFFTVTDGSVDGCGVHDRGEVRSALTGFGRDFADCTAGPSVGVMTRNARTPISLWSCWAHGTCSTWRSTANSSRSRRQRATNSGLRTQAGASTRSPCTVRRLRCSKYPACGQFPTLEHGCRRYLNAAMTSECALERAASDGCRRARRRVVRRRP